jgi:hypothetical protein
MALKNQKRHNPQKSHPYPYFFYKVKVNVMSYEEEVGKAINEAIEKIQAVLGRRLTFDEEIAVINLYKTYESFLFSGYPINPLELFNQRINKIIEQIKQNKQKITFYQ